MTAAVDAGRIINPDSAAAQVQGNIIMGLSSALVEEATVKDGAWRRSISAPIAS